MLQTQAGQELLDCCAKFLDVPGCMVQQAGALAVEDEDQKLAEVIGFLLDTHLWLSRPMRCDPYL
jgi:hypothetical protein